MVTHRNTPSLPCIKWWWWMHLICLSQVTWVSSIGWWMISCELLSADYWEPARSMESQRNNIFHHQHHWVIITAYKYVHCAYMYYAIMSIFDFITSAFLLPRWTIVYGSFAVDILLIHLDVRWINDRIVDAIDVRPYKTIQFKSIEMMDTAADWRTLTLWVWWSSIGFYWLINAFL